MKNYPSAGAWEHGLCGRSEGEAEESGSPKDQLKSMAGFGRHVHRAEPCLCCRVSCWLCSSESSFTSGRFAGFCCFVSLWGGGGGGLVCRLFVFNFEEGGVFLFLLLFCFPCCSFAFVLLPLHPHSPITTRFYRGGGGGALFKIEV